MPTQTLRNNRMIFWSSMPGYCGPKLDSVISAEPEDIAGHVGAMRISPSVTGNLTRYADSVNHYYQTKPNAKTYTRNVTQKIDEQVIYLYMLDEVFEKADPIQMEMFYFQGLDHKVCMADWSAGGVCLALSAIWLKYILDHDYSGFTAALGQWDANFAVTVRSIMQAQKVTQALFEKGLRDAAMKDFRAKIAGKPANHTAKFMQKYGDMHSQGTKLALKIIKKERPAIMVSSREFVIAGDDESLVRKVKNAFRDNGSAALLNITWLGEKDRYLSGHAVAFYPAFGLLFDPNYGIIKVPTENKVRDTAKLFGALLALYEIQKGGAVQKTKVEATYLKPKPPPKPLSRPRSPRG